MERYEAAYEAIAQSPSRRWTRNGVSYEITKLFKQRRHGGYVVAIDLRASIGGRVIYDDRNNISNPPLNAVVDGATVANPLFAIQQVLEAGVAEQTDSFRRPHLKRVGDTDIFTGDTLTAFAVNDGYLNSSHSTSWSIAQAGNAVTANTGNPNEILVSISGSSATIRLSYLRFDTSSLGSGDTITAYTLTLYGNGTAEVNAHSTTVQARVHPGYGAGDVDTGDWVDCSTTFGSLTLFATFTTSGWDQTADNPNAFTSQGASSAINIDGDTDIVLGHSNVTGSVPSSGSDRVSFRSSEQTGTSSDPKLVITYTVPPQFIVPDPVEIEVTVPAVTVTGGTEIIAPDAVSIALTVPDHAFLDLIRYERIEQQSWSGDIFNRIQAGISPYSIGDEVTVWSDPGPYALSSGESVELTAAPTDLIAEYTGHTRDVDPQTSPDPVVESGTSQAFTAATSWNVTMPGTVVANEALIVILSIANTNGTVTGPAGWTRKLVTLSPYTTLGLAIFVRLADGTEGGLPMTFTNNASSAAVAHVYRISNWAEDISDAGIAISGAASGSNPAPDPSEVTWGWGERSSMVIALYVTATATNPSGYPTGYANAVTGTSTSLNLASARRVVANADAEDPGNFTAGVTFWMARAIAIAGVSAPDPIVSADPSGSSGRFRISYDPAAGGTTQLHSNIQVTGIPILTGDEQIVEVNDVASQDAYGIATYRNPAQLFRSTGDALIYANLVLARYKDRHPIMTIGFTASKSDSHYGQVKARRVGDRITLVATNNAGLGISEDFWIESINLRASQGSTLMEAEYHLSPVSAGA